MRGKIALVGGGLAGLTAGYELARAGFEVCLFEREEKLGGLASGFKLSSWDWSLERIVHHIFATDKEILKFAKRTGFSGIFFKTPLTGSVYRTEQGYKIFALDTPLDFLRFPLLPLKDKLRAAAVLAFLRFSSFLPFYEKKIALDFLKEFMGEKANMILWEELFRKKFGKYAEKILLSFFWARIKKRTKSLGYIKGGFQSFVHYLGEKVEALGGSVVKGLAVEGIEKEEEKYRIFTEKEVFTGFDKVIFALQLPIVLKVGKKVLPSEYIKKMKKISYLNAVSLVLETDKPLVDKFYWVNSTEKDLPFLGVFQQTNFIDKKYYGGRDVGYIGWYCTEKDWVWKASKDEILKLIKPYLLNLGFKGKILRSKLFKAAFAQPIFNKAFVENKPSYLMPVEGLYFAGFELSYPYDRGTNYAVKVGEEVAKVVLRRK